MDKFSKGNLVTVILDPKRRGVITGEKRVKRGKTFWSVKPKIWPAAGVSEYFDWESHPFPPHFWVPESQLMLVRENNPTRKARCSCVDRPGKTWQDFDYEKHMWVCRNCGAMYKPRIRKRSEDEKERYKRVREMLDKFNKTGRFSNPEDVLCIGDVLEVEDDIDIYVAEDPGSGKRTKSIINAVYGDLIRYDGYHGKLRGVKIPLFKFMFMPLTRDDQIAEQERFYTTAEGVNVILRNTEFMYNERD